MGTFATIRGWCLYAIFGLFATPFLWFTGNYALLALAPEKEVSQQLFFVWIAMMSVGLACLIKAITSPTSSETQEEEGNDTKKGGLSPWQTISITGTMVGLLGAIPTILVIVIFPKWGFFKPALWLGFTLLIGKLLPLSFEKIVIGHGGLFTSFGERTRIKLREGLHPILKGFIGHYTKDLTDQTYNISPLDIQASGENDTQVELTVDLSIDYRIKDIYANAEISDLLEKIKTFAYGSLRRYATRKTDEEMISSRKEIAEYIKRDMADDAKRWGIEIVKVEVTDIEDSNPDAKDARDQKRVEELRAKASKVAAETINKNAKSIKDGLDGVTGQEALRASRGLSNKDNFKSQEHIVTGLSDLAETLKVLLRGNNS